MKYTPLARNFKHIGSMMFAGCLQSILMKHIEGLRPIRNRVFEYASANLPQSEGRVMTPIIYTFTPN